MATLSPGWDSNQQIAEQRYQRIELCTRKSSRAGRPWQRLSMLCTFGTRPRPDCLALWGDWCFEGSEESPGQLADSGRHGRSGREGSSRRRMTKASLCRCKVLLFRS